MGGGDVLNPDLRKVLVRFKQETGIEKVIVFGSHVSSSAGDESDVDLVLVDGRFRGKKFYLRPVGLHRHWHSRWPMDFLCYTPEEFEELRGRPTIVRTAVEEGVSVI